MNDGKKWSSYVLIIIDIYLQQYDEILKHFIFQTGVSYGFNNYIIIH